MKRIIKVKKRIEQKREREVRSSIKESDDKGIKEEMKDQGVIRVTLLMILLKIIKLKKMKYRLSSV